MRSAYIMYTVSVYTSQRTQGASIRKVNRRMLCGMFTARIKVHGTHECDVFKRIQRF